MKTYWKEKYIGKVLGGFLEDKNISIYKTDYIVVWDKNGIYEYINKNSIIEYNNINSSSKTKLGKAIVGDMLFGVAGTISMGKEEEFLLEVKWVNGKKSIISIIGTTFYQFFLSKLYEDGISLLSKQMDVEKTNRIKEEEKNIKEKITELEIEFHLNKQDINYLENEDNDTDGFSRLTKFLELLPYYKAEYENNYNIINDCEKNIELYNKLINDDNIKEYISKNYKKNVDDKLNWSFWFADWNYDDTLSDEENIIFFKEHSIIEEGLFSDEEILEMIEKNEEECKDYLNRKFIDNDLFNYLNNLHKQNGYIYVGKTKDIQKNQIETYKNKIPQKLYNLLNQILEYYIIYDDMENVFYPSSLIEINWDTICGKIVAPSHFLISYFLNCYFGKIEDKETKTTNNNNSSKYDEIRKIKDLLDIGVITQEEFEIEKNKLLSN